MELSTCAKNNLKLKTDQRDNHSSQFTPDALPVCVNLNNMTKKNTIARAITKTLATLLKSPFFAVWMSGGDNETTSVRLAPSY